jgi:hypothetical protein
MPHRIVAIGLPALIPILLLAACMGAETVETRSPEPPAPTAEKEYRFNQILDLDAIRPVYDPVFIAAEEADLADEQLVLGVAIDDQAKAYPIAVLNGREMVNDELAGIPILATW